MEKHAADFPSLPPEEEVKAQKRYEYIPYPNGIVNPCMAVQFIHEYFTAGQHLENYWINRLPKKLNDKLIFNSTVVNIGWGIHIIEEPNWVAFSLLATFVVLLSGIIAVMYSVLMHDVSAGFGMAAYLVSIQALTVTTLFFKWQNS